MCETSVVYSNNGGGGVGGDFDDDGENELLRGRGCELGIEGIASMKSNCSTHTFAFYFTRIVFDSVHEWFCNLYALGA